MKKESKRNSRRSGGKVASGIVVLGAAGLLYSRFIPGAGTGLLPGEGSSIAQPDAPQQTMAAETILPEEIIIEAEPESDETQDNAVNNSGIEEQEYDYSADNILSIEVVEDKIYYEGEEITAADLEQRLLSDVREGMSVSLTDNHAIKGTFDEVKAILSKLSLS
ncbi:MAG: hypothetical protein Q4F31_07815 [Eubacteriales bacterium]|nr:hypothetical protein [Eubacteriales bacterium]